MLYSDGTALNSPHVLAFWGVKNSTQIKWHQFLSFAYLFKMCASCICINTRGVESKNFY